MRKVRQNIKNPRTSEFLISKVNKINGKYISYVYILVAGEVLTYTLPPAGRWPKSLV